MKASNGNSGVSFLSVAKIAIMLTIGYSVYLVSQDFSRFTIAANIPMLDRFVPKEIKERHTIDNKKDTIQETALEHGLKHLDPTYICPMHSQIVSKDKDMPCPICGMDLVAIENSDSTGIVQLSASVINSLGVRTATVERRTLYRRIDTIGYVAYDENHMSTVNLRTEGWIEKLHTKSLGAKVSKGDLLFEFYAPKLVNAQEELINAQKFRRTNLVKASVERLRALGVSNSQIKSVMKNRKVERRIKVFAPQNGFISSLTVREGQFVAKSAAVIGLVDLTSVWLIAEVFEKQVGWVKVGQKAKITLAYAENKRGEVEYIYPDLDPKTRSVKVRLRFDNSAGFLKPNMFADVIIYAKPRKQVIAIPIQAVIRVDGEERVIVAENNGQFRPVKVSTGIESRDMVEILFGLEEGQEVVERAQFLIDSESSKRASFLRMAK